MRERDGRAGAGSLEERAEFMPEASVIRLLIRAAVDAGDFRRREVTAPLQVTEIQQVGVAGEDGERLVRRVAVAGRTERTDLPPGETARRQGLDEAVGFRAERPDGSRAR